MEHKTRRKRITVALSIILIWNVSNMTLSEILRSIRGVDALRLIACGMLIGALVMNLVMTYKENKENT